MHRSTQTGNPRSHRPTLLAAERRHYLRRLAVLGVLLSCVIAAGATPNDRIGDQFIANGPDIEALTFERTETALLVSLSLDGAFTPPSPDRSGVVGFIDLDTDQDATSGQQSAVDFLGGSRLAPLRSLLGVEYQLVLSSWSTEDGAVDLVDQATRQTIARVNASFAGTTLKITIPDSVLSPGILDDLHLAAIVGNHDDFTDVVPDQGFISTSLALGEELQGGRFTVAVEWTDFEGGTGVGTLVTKSTDSALFWFFNENNWELLVKVLDGCALTNTYWVFSAATTNVQFTLTVTDTVTGAVRVYENPLGVAAAAINDIEAFASCAQ